MASKSNHGAISDLGPNEDALCFIKTGFNLKMLKPLDEALRCRICYDYFNNCMITKCSHNYCSVCIRRYMLYKAQCPTCFQEASEPELRNNRLVDEVLRVYVQIKETLENAVQIKSEPQEELFKPGSPTTVKIKKEPLTTDEKDASKASDKTEMEHAGLKFNEVSCPVCYQTVLEDRINNHLDKCLISKEEPLAERKHLPKLVYHLLSEKEIKKKLKDHNLSHVGDRQTLIRRLKNFTVLHNANCDSLNPEPVSELIKELEAQELEERLNATPKKSQVHKKSDVSEIEKEHALHVKKHQSQFNNLIYDVQQRELNRTTIKKEVLEDSAQSCDPFSDRLAESVAVETSVVVNPEPEYKSSSTHSRDKAIHPNSNNEKGTCSSKKGENSPITHKNVEEEPIFPSLVKNVTEFSKSSEKIQESLRKDSPSSVEDFEMGKIQLSLLRKRKKGRISLDKKQCSPKKK